MKKRTHRATIGERGDMKSKGSASLYEVLKSASRPGTDPGPAAMPPAETPAAATDGQKTLQERLAEYKARKLADAQTDPLATSVAVAEATPLPVAVADLTPSPVPVAAPMPAGDGGAVRPWSSHSTNTLTPLATPSALPSKAAAGPGERVLRVTY